MELKCVAIDDVPYALKLLKVYAEKIPEIQLVQTFEDPFAGAAYLKEHPVDILFIDINMPDISGLDLVQSLQQKPIIIFTTAYKEFAYNGFELEALDYLLKPFKFDRFHKAVQKAIAFYNSNKPILKPVEESFFVNSGYKAIKIVAGEIEYIESQKNYVQIHLENAEPVLTAMPLKNLLEKLPKGQFLRIHRSFVVPEAKVKSILKGKILLTTGKELPIGDYYYKVVQDLKNSGSPFNDLLENKPL